MKYLTVIILIIFSIGALWILSPEIQAKIILNPDKASKVTLLYGYKGSFCSIGTIWELKNPLTLYLGRTPEDIQASYSAMMTSYDCRENEKEIIIGDVRIDYEKGYSGDETFFITDNQMYRAGGRFYSYYEDSSQGGTWYDNLSQEDVKGLKYIGSDRFFTADYQNDTASGSATLNDTGYLKEFDVTGNEKGILLVYNGSIYRLTKKEEEKSNIVLIDYTLLPSPTPTVELELTPTDKPASESGEITPSISPTAYESSTVFPLPTLASPSGNITPTNL